MSNKQKVEQLSTRFLFLCFCFFLYIIICTAKRIYISEARTKNNKKLNEWSAKQNKMPWNKKQKNETENERSYDEKKRKEKNVSLSIKVTKYDVKYT